MEALGLFPTGMGEDARRRAVWEGLKEVMPFLESSLTGEVGYRSGRCRRFIPRDRSWRALDEHLRNGCRPHFFRYRQLTFLRNEGYIGTNLTEGILSGVMAAP
jgi:hypothetical protein